MDDSVFGATRSLDSCLRVVRTGQTLPDAALARCCPGSATARPYWPAEPVPAALALIASALSRTAMALFLAGTIAGEAGVSAACSGGGRPRHG